MLYIYVRACVCTYEEYVSFYLLRFFRWCVLAFLITLQSAAAAAAAALVQLQSIISIHIHSQLDVCVCVVLFFSLLCFDDDTHMLTLTHMMRTITCIGRRHTHTHFQRGHAKYHGTSNLCVITVVVFLFFALFSLLFCCVLLIFCSVVHTDCGISSPFFLDCRSDMQKKNIYFCVWAVRDAMTD